jgi:hypothetical protein
LKNLLGVIRSLDEGSFVGWTHFERLKITSWDRLEDRLKSEPDRWTMARRKGLSGTTGLYVEMDVAGHLRSMQYL